MCQCLEQHYSAHDAGTGGGPKDMRQWSMKQEQRKHQEAINLFFFSLSCKQIVGKVKVINDQLNVILIFMSGKMKTSVS